MKSARMYRWITSGVLAAAVMMIFAVATEANAADRKKAGDRKKAAAKKKAGAGKKAGDRKKAAARKKGKGGGSQKHFSDDEIYAKMDFTPQQREKFEAARQKLQTALDEWDATPKGQKLIELQAAVEMADTPEEKRKVAGMLGQIRGLLAERSAIERRCEPQILTTLTPEQKATRLGYKLCNRILTGKLGKALNGDQVNKLKSYCMQAGEGIVKGSVSAGRAEVQLQSLAVGMLNDGQKKKLGLRVPPKKEPKKDNKNRRRRNKKPTKKQIEAYKKQVAAQKKALDAAKKK